MPSFDVVSEVDIQEVRNAVDQANREVANRFDFKGVDASFELNESEIALRAEQEFQLGQMMDMMPGQLGQAARQADPNEIEKQLKRSEAIMKRSRSATGSFW